MSNDFQSLRSVGKSSILDTAGFLDVPLTLYHGYSKTYFVW